MYRVAVAGEQEEGSDFAKLSSLPAPNGALSEQVYLSKVKENVKLTAEGHFQDTRYLSLDLADYSSATQTKIPDGGALFIPGDIIMV